MLADVGRSWPSTIARTGEKALAGYYQHRPTSTPKVKNGWISSRFPTTVPPPRARPSEFPPAACSHYPVSCAPDPNQSAPFVARDVRLPLAHTRLRGALAASTARDIFTHDRL